MSTEHTWDTNEAYNLIANEEWAYLDAKKDDSDENLEAILVSILEQYKLDVEHIMFHLIDWTKVRRLLNEE
jgi:hypothetical protein